MTELCIFLLTLLSAIVFCGQVAKENVWLFICAYWLVLTGKNVIDYKQAMKGKGHDE